MAVSVNGGALTFDAWVNDSQFKAQIDAMEQRIKSLSDSANGEAKAIEDLAEKAATAIGAYLSISSATDFIKKMIEVRGEFQQLEVAFTTMLQSKEKADQLLAEVARLAANTPFGLQDAAQGTKQLLAYGFQAEEITKTLTMLGNVASGVSAPLNDIVYLYGTLKTQGRAYSQDIKQFTGRGIPIIEKLAEQFGVSADKVNDLVGAGKVGFPEIEKAFSSMTQEGGMFFNLMEEQSKTLTGRISNLEDAFMLMLNNMGKSSEGVAYAAISALTSLVENYQQILNILEILIATYGTYRAAVIAVNVVDGIRAALIGVNTAGLGAMTVAEYLHYQALVITEKAQKLLNATMLSNPYVAIATVLAALTATLLITKAETIELRTEQELLQEAYDKAADSIDSQSNAVKTYVSILENANSTEAERLKAYDKLKAIDPKIVEGIDAKAVSQAKLTENVNNYIEALRNKLKLEANEQAISKSQGIENQLRERIANIQKVIDEQTANRDEAADSFFGRGVKKRAQQLIDAQTRIRQDYEAQLKKQEESTNNLRVTENKQQANAQEQAKKTNAELIAQAQSLEALKMIRQDIDEKYEQAATKAEREQLSRDKRLADSKKKELDIYGQTKKAATEAIKENNKLKSLLEKITELETKATSITDGKEEGSVAKITAEVERLKKAAEALKASDGVKLRIQRAGQILIDDATAKATAKDIENKLNTELSNINIKIAATESNSATELELKKAAIDAETNLQTAALKQQFSNDISSQLALQSRIAEIQAQARRQKLELDKEFARRSADAQIAAINRQLDRSNIADQAILNDPTATAAQRFEAQQNILKRSKKALEDIKSVLYNLKLSGKGDIKEINIEIENLNNNIKEINNQLDITRKNRLNEVLSSIGDVLSNAGYQLKGFATSLSEINPELAATLNIMGDIVGKVAEVGITLASISKVVKDSVNSTGGAIKNALQSKDVVALIANLINVFASIVTIRNRESASSQAAYLELEGLQTNILVGEYEYNKLLRERNIYLSEQNELTFSGLEAKEKALQLAQKQNQEDYKSLLNTLTLNDLAKEYERIYGKPLTAFEVLTNRNNPDMKKYREAFEQLQDQRYIVSSSVEEYGGFLGIGKKSRVVNEYASLLGMTFEQIEKLYTEGRLEGKTKQLFEELKSLQEEGKKIQEQLDALAQQAKEIYTGTTADSITDSIVDGFKNGYFAAQDFAANFEELMRQAALNSLKYQYLEEPLKAFYDQFANAAQTDNVLTAQEIADLQEKYNKIIKDAGDKFQQLQDITQLDLANGSGTQNSLQGAMQSLTEQTGELLAGQLGAMRMTGVQQLQVMTQQLSVLNNIERNTSQLFSIESRLRLIETQGIKIRS